MQFYYLWRPPATKTTAAEVKDVSASTASVETTPNDNTVPYFCDAVTKAEYDKAGEDAFIAGLLESYEVQLEEGETFAQFWEKKSKRGKGSWTLSGLTPQTEYYTFAFAVDTNSGEVLSKVFLSEAFTTADAPSRCLPQPRNPKRNSKWSCKSPMRRKYMH